MRISIRALGLLLLGSAGCVAPITQFGTVSREEVLAEQARQRRLALETQLYQQARVEDVAFPLLQAAAPLCGSAAGLRTGLRFGSAHTFAAGWVNAALDVGLTDTLVVMHAARGSGSARAGLRDGDRVLAIAGQSIRVGPKAPADAKAVIDRVQRSGAQTLQVTYRRDTVTATVDVPLDRVCTYGLVVEKSEALNAYANGQLIVVTSTMLRFTDDDGLAVVLAHEIAHNAMRHHDAKTTNATLGALLGAIADVAFAYNGVNTGGEYAARGAQAGAQAFSQDFEREADYVGQHVLAAAGRPLGAAPAFWRQMAVEKPTSINFGSTHPTTAERFVRLEHATREIETKLASGVELRPELRSTKMGPAPALALLRTTGPTERADVVALAPTESRSSQPTTPSRVTTAVPSKPTTSPAGPAPQPRPVPQTATDNRATARSNSGDYFEWVFGPPVPMGGLDTAAVRRLARREYEAGLTEVKAGRWSQAEKRFREATRLDGSTAEYHAALGKVFMHQRLWVEAQALFTAAVLLDVENPEYRRLLMQARESKP